MADVVSADKRSKMMRGIKGKNTKPEMIVRSYLHKKGLRFRLHRKDLPGNPDIVLPKYKTAIQVRGCFWHVHNCHYFKYPKSNSDFWRKKLTGNVARDKINDEKLKQLGWNLIVIWECELRTNSEKVIEKAIAVIRSKT